MMTIILWQGSPMTAIGLRRNELIGRAESPLVIILDDDVDIREAYGDLFASVGLEVASYGSVAAFLSATLPDRPACLVLDVRMPGESGLDLQDRLHALDVNIPIVFVTGYADIEMSVKAMKRGAVNFLAKPLREQDLLDAVTEALKQDGAHREKTRGLRELRELASQLTQREREVLRGVARGLLSKQIAHELGIAETTVKMHRSAAFRKLKAVTAADLVQKAKLLED